ncbi:MAG: aminotransferase class I/II-fold pyridoxal phosphate-dependent enzyme [Bdellovibrionales bacterium]
MSLAKAIRLKRLNVKPGHDVSLTLEARSGRQYTLSIANCSIHGLAAHAPEASDFGDDFLEDDIIPASKLKFGNTEVTLGRLVIKRAPSKEAPQTMVGFATVDSKVPIDGPLSKYLSSNFDSGSSPFDLELGSNQFSIASFVGTDMNNVDLFERTKKFGIFYNDWKKSEKFGYFMKRDQSKGARINLTRKRPGNRSDYLMMGSNDYLGLAAHPEVIEAALQAVKVYGFGSTGTPHTSGYSTLHDQLCRKLAQMYGKEDAIIYASGYAANVGIVSGLCREHDLIVADMISHASIHDGMTMSRAACRLFKHNDMNHLRQILEENRANHSGCLIVTEGAFSMDGTVGRLDQIHKIAREFDARVMIDQAHCVGVLGSNGLGTVEHYGLIDETDVIMGLFSKAWGGVGGFAVGSSDLCNWLRSFSRGFIFATSFPPANAAATLKAIEVMQRDGLVAKLQENIAHFVKGMRQIGAPIDPSHNTAIVPIEIRNEAKMGKMYQSLLDNGVFVIPVVYPVVSRNRCRFRFSVRADLSIGDLDYVISTLERAMKDAGFTFDEVKDNKAA